MFWIASFMKQYLCIEDISFLAASSKYTSFYVFYTLVSDIDNRFLVSWWIYLGRFLKNILFIYLEEEERHTQTHTEGELGWKEKEKNWELPNPMFHSPNAMKARNWDPTSGFSYGWQESLESPLLSPKIWNSGNLESGDRTLLEPRHSDLWCGPCNC